MPFAVWVGMSKQNNRNPGQYDSTRNHPGEGVVNDQEKKKFEKGRESQGQEGDRNFIPGEEPAGEKSDK